MLELAILGLLKEKAMHGYELKKQLNQKLGHFWQVSFGSLYPTLNRLEERGAIAAVFGGDETSRRKNVYRITEVGEQRFLELIEDPASTAWEEEKFPLRFAFFRYVKPEIRLRLLERRKTYLEERLEDLRVSLDEAADRIDGYTLSLMRHGLEATASDLAWLDELIAAERRQVAAEVSDTRGRGGQDSSAGPAERARPTEGRAPRRTESGIAEHDPPRERGNPPPTEHRATARSRP